MKIEIVPQKGLKSFHGLTVGRWYTDDKNEKHKFYVLNVTEDNYWFDGPDVYGRWGRDEFYAISPDVYKYRELSDAEIKAVLQKEMRERYKNLPCPVTYLDHVEGKKDVLKGYACEYENGELTVSDGGRKGFYDVMWKNGEWAKKR